MKISVSSYSYYQAIRDGRLTLEQTIDKAHEMGFEAIEFLDMPGATQAERLAFAKELKKRADAHGMTINAYTIGANLYHDTAAANQAEVDRMKAQIDVAVELGCSVMRHDVCYATTKQGNGRSFGLMLPTIAQNARTITEYGAKCGIITCSENHGYIAQDSYRIEQLFNAVAHDNFGLLVDVGNFVCADEDNAAAVSRVAPYAVHVHAKDMYKSTEPKPGYGRTRGCNYFAGAAVGEGDCNVQKCIEIIRTTGYDGYYSIEFEGAEDCYTAIARGYENLKRFLS